ncbi:MAG: hypothetical protein B7X04_02135 [Parcubacteria group bacterium 21-54-25]|nr:MAG: hypothetical protein B7X04_02135 [Parcubacteria group bacterium 21-54-25]HQU07846.1 type II secretion system protein [Candidatus Paceibacterota bacterium]
MKNNTHYMHAPRGFTLIEMLVTIAITAVVMTALTFLIQYFYRTNTYVFEQTAAVENARNGVLTAMRYLREASYGADGSYPITSVATSSVEFYVDIQGNGIVDRVHLYRLGTTLYQGVTVPVGNPLSYVGQPEATTTLATYVRNSTSTPIFRYYDAKGNELTPPITVANIASVNTTVTVNLNPARAPEDFTLSVGATLRNLRAAP